MQKNKNFLIFKQFFFCVAESAQILPINTVKRGKAFPYKNSWSWRKKCLKT